MGWFRISITFLTSVCSAAQPKVCPFCWSKVKKCLSKGNPVANGANSIAGSCPQFSAGWSCHEGHKARRTQQGSLGHLHRELLFRVNNHISSVTTYTVSKADLSQNVFWGKPLWNTVWKHWISSPIYKVFTNLLILHAWHWKPCLCFKQSPSVSRQWSFPFFKQIENVLKL